MRMEIINNSSFLSLTHPLSFSLSFSLSLSLSLSLLKGWGLLADNMPPQFHTKKYMFGVEVFYTNEGDCKRFLVWGGGDVEGAVRPPKEIIYEKVGIFICRFI